jgi:hypothetical protein
MPVAAAGTIVCPWLRNVPAPASGSGRTALLVVNVALTSPVTQPSARTRIPYSPLFLQQVREGHVVSITSKGHDDPGHRRWDALAFRLQACVSRPLVSSGLKEKSAH